jgi:hypothetical protein
MIPTAFHKADDCLVRLSFRQHKKGVVSWEAMFLSDVDGGWCVDMLSACMMANEAAKRMVEEWESERWTVTDLSVKGGGT